MCVTFYAVLRYQFIDIEVIIRKTLVFAGLLAFVFGVFSFGLFIAQNVLASYFAFSREWALAVSMFFIVLGYEPMRAFLINITDRFLFQKKYDYQKFLKDASRGMSQIESLHHLLGLVTHFITMKMRLKSAAVLMQDPKTGQFHLRHGRGYPLEFAGGPPLFIKNPLLQYINLEEEAAEIEQVKEDAERGPKRHRRGTRVREYDYRNIQKEMEKLHAACCIPSFLGRDLKSVLVLGEKKSGDAYSQEDINVLFTLAQESAIAIENARLYDEAVNRTRELERMNKELSLTNEKLQVTQASLIVAEKNATMVGMAKAIGHEVNNPLSALMLTLSRISSGYTVKAKAVLERNSGRLSEEDLGELQKLLASTETATLKVDRSAQRISAVIHTLTDILKGSKGEMGPLSLLVLCKEALEATRFSTYEENLSGCEIVEDIQPNILVMGNLEQLLQVFVNLIKNAYEAMGSQKNRRIVISGTVDPPDPRMARIEVSDNGPGIPPEVLPRIWLQGFSTKQRRDESMGAAGQGQGLFVVKHIIESIHKGLITVESGPGKGTKFILKLPLAEVGIDV